MRNLHALTPTIIAATLSGFLTQPALAEAPNIQTKGAIIHLADNLQEEAKLGWCIDTDGRDLTDLLHAHSCKPSGNDVLFSYATDTGMIASVTYKNKCMAFNAPENAVNPFGLVECDNSASDQKFLYDAEAMEMRLDTDPTKCLTVAPVIDEAGPFQSRDLILASCDSLEPSFKQWIVRG
ncbi:MAG: RICIN domain-containing protein [Paracoccaceae bacterium]